MNPLLTALMGPLANLLGRLIPDPAEQAKAQLELAKLAPNGELAELHAAVQIILAAATGTWLQRSWRPVRMLTFGGLIVARWFGFAAPNLAESEYLHLWDIVQIAIGGGIIGRSAEKAATAISGALRK